jgi:hypothetical protein
MMSRSKNADLSGHEDIRPENEAQRISGSTGNEIQFDFDGAASPLLEKKVYVTSPGSIGCFYY